MVTGKVSVKVTEVTGGLGIGITARVTGRIIVVITGRLVLGLLEGLMLRVTGRESARVTGMINFVITGRLVLGLLEGLGLE